MNLGSFSKYSFISKFVKGCGEEFAGIRAFSFPSPALQDPSPALTVPFPDNFFVNRSPSKLAPNVPSNIDNNLPYFPFVSFLIVFVKSFNKIPRFFKA